MNFGQIEALYRIMRNGSFVAAARELHVTQSALSHRIKVLEKLIGAPLFVRTKRRVVLTALGEEIAGHAERIFHELDEIKNRLARTKGVEATGSLRVAATNTGTGYLYGDFFERFIAEYPRIDLQIIAAATVHDAILRLRDWRADIAFTTYPSATETFDALTLGSAELVLIAAPNHPVCKANTVDVAELRKWPYVRHLPGAGARVVEDELFQRSGGFPRILSESSDTEYIKRIVSLRLGLSFVPLFSVMDELRTGLLRALRLDDRVIMQDFGIVYRKEPRSTLIDEFVGMCKRICQVRPKRFVLSDAVKTSKRR